MFRGGGVSFNATRRRVPPANDARRPPTVRRLVGDTIVVDDPAVVYRCVGTNDDVDDVDARIFDAPLEFESNAHSSEYEFVCVNSVEF